MERADYVNDWGFDANHTEVGVGRFALFSLAASVSAKLRYTISFAELYVQADSSDTSHCLPHGEYLLLGINSLTELLPKFKDI